MPYMSQTPVPYLTRLPQSGSPGAAPSGSVLEYIDSADGTLYSVDSSGAVHAIGGQIYGPVSNTAQPVALPPIAPDPWTPHGASDWYARDGVTPGAWTLDAGLSVAYPGNGYGLITWPNDTTVRKAVATLGGSAPFQVVARVNGIADDQQNTFLHIGVSAAGDLTDLCGVAWNFGGQSNVVLDGSQRSANHYLPTTGCASGWVWWWISHTGSVLSVHASMDGLAYTLLYSGASTLSSPSAVVVAVNGPVLDEGQNALWLDYIAQANTPPNVTPAGGSIQPDRLIRNARGAPLLTRRQ